MSAAVEVRPTIDRRWLERAASREPLTHAYALWDLDRTPVQVRFASAVRGEETVGYLLIWLGQRERPVVHWYGAVDLAGPLLKAFPAAPFLAVVPPEVEPTVAAAFPGAVPTALRMMLRERAWLDRRAGSVRRLAREDRPQLEALVQGEDAPDLGFYLGVDPGAEPIWGAFAGGRLVGVARAAVRLARLWVLGGVFVQPAHRNEGLGAALVTAVVIRAEASGAAVGLYAREEPANALRLYERLGFREVGRRFWLDVRVPRPG